jgi:hypothetical protein
MEFIGGSMSDSSKRLYMHNLKKLNDNKELKDFNFLKKTDDVMKKMPTNRNTARSYIIAAVNATKGRKGFKKALEFYTKKMDEINAELKDATNKTSEFFAVNLIIPSVSIIGEPQSLQLHLKPSAKVVVT